MVGGFFIENGKKDHHNYGTLESNKLPKFASRVFSILEKDKK